MNPQSACMQLRCNTGESDTQSVVIMANIFCCSIVLNLLVEASQKKAAVAASRIAADEVVVRLAIQHE